MSIKTINIILKATENCDLRCKYCYNADSSHTNALLPLADLQRLFELCAKEYDAVSIVWHGGEPLLCGMDYMQNAMDIQHHILSEKGTRFENSIQTNGTLITPAWIRFFKKHSFGVGVSFDGVTNEKYRGQSEKVLSAMKLMKKHHLDFGCISVVGDDDVDFIGNYRLFKSLGVSFVLSPVFTEGAAKGMKPLSADTFTEKAKQLFDIWLYDKDGVGIRLFTEYISMLLGGKVRVCTNGSCHGKWLGITPDCNIYNCGREEMQRYSFGNIRTLERITDCFASDGFVSLLEGAIERRKKCKESCGLFMYCQSHCSDCAITEGALSDIPSFSCRCFREIFTYVKERTRDITDGKVRLSELNPAIRNIVLRGMSY